MAMNAVQFQPGLPMMKMGPLEWTGCRLADATETLLAISTVALCCRCHFVRAAEGTTLKGLT